MKTTIAPHATKTVCLRIVCLSGLTVRLTRYPVDLAMSNGAVYQSGTGYDFTDYQATASFSPSAIDLEGFIGYAGVTRDAIMSGIFDNARCYLFACDFLDPVEDYEPIVASILGKTSLEDDKYTIEEMALIDALNQSVGEIYSPACRHVFGSQSYAGCKVDLGPLTVTGALTHVAGPSVVRDSARSEAADWFGAGTIAFSSGANAGLKPMEIKIHAADGTITTHEAFYYPPQVGDAYVLIPGCRKRLSDCRDKWEPILLTGKGNVDNFGGFPNVPTSSMYQQIGGNR